MVTEEVLTLDLNETTNENVLRVIRLLRVCQSVGFHFSCFNMRSASGPAAVRGRIMSSSECVGPPF